MRREEKGGEGRVREALGYYLCDGKGRERKGRSRGKLKRNGRGNKDSMNGYSLDLFNFLFE